MPHTIKIGLKKKYMYYLDVKQINANKSMKLMEYVIIFYLRLFFYRCLIMSSSEMYSYIKCIVGCPHKGMWHTYS